MNLCTQCNKGNRNLAQFCTNCGAKLKLHKKSFSFRRSVQYREQTHAQRMVEVGYAELSIDPKELVRTSHPIPNVHDLVEVLSGETIEVEILADTIERDALIVLSDELLERVDDDAESYDDECGDDGVQCYIVSGVSDEFEVEKESDEEPALLLMDMEFEEDSEYDMEYEHEHDLIVTVDENGHEIRNGRKQRHGDDEIENDDIEWDGD